MDGNAELGPIDRQFVIQKGDGSIIICPAQTIKDQFEMASGILAKNPSDLPVWIPILQQYGPSLLKQVDNAMELSQELVTKWLVSYMFAGSPDAKEKAKEVAGYFSNHNFFKTHSRRIGLREIREKGLPLKVVDAGADSKLQRCILRLYTAIVHTFAGTGVFKMYENSQGQGFFRVIQHVLVRGGQATPTAIPTGGKKKKK